MTGQTTFRTATGADLPAILALLADDPLGKNRETSDSPAYRAAFDAIAADPNQQMAVAELSGVVIGYMQITYIPGLSRGGAWRGQLESVRIATPHRGQGIGAQFFHWAFAQCKARNCALVQLTTDTRRPDALRFYERLGFAASHHGLKHSL